MSMGKCFSPNQIRVLIRSRLRWPEVQRPARTPLNAQFDQVSVSIVVRASPRKQAVTPQLLHDGGTHLPTLFAACSVECRLSSCHNTAGRCPLTLNEWTGRALTAHYTCTAVECYSVRHTLVYSAVKCTVVQCISV